MANPVRIAGGNIDGDVNEGYHAQVDQWGNLRTRQGVFKGTYKVYESSVSASEDIINFDTDSGRTHIVDGWLINDGDDDITIKYAQSGNTLIYGESFTVKESEMVDFLRLDVSKIKIASTGSASYRMLLI